MRVGLLYSRFAGMPQAMWGALRDDGHDVVRPEDLGITPPMSAAAMAAFARRADADVLVGPFLKEVVPAEVCRRWPVWIPHPGIRGDAGPTSLSWAILDGAETWGVTMVRAEPSRSAADLDSGNVGAWREFPLPADATVAEVYAQQVTAAAVACAREVLARTRADPAFDGVALSSSGPGLRRRYRPAVSQDRLAFRWGDDPDEIRRRIRAATFGVRSELDGRAVNVFDAHPAHPAHPPHPGCGADARFRPGRILAEGNGAVLIGAGESGAVWIGHAKVRRAQGRGLKLPAALSVEGGVPELRRRSPRLGRRGAPPRAIIYRRHGRVGWLRAPAYNGAFSTSFCQRLLGALQYAAGQDTRVIAVSGDQVAWCNGIHLGVIEAATDPRAEAWANVCRIDDVAELVFGLSRGTSGYPPQTTVAVLSASAGAGGAVLSACFDVVLARSTITLNYHYANLGLSGSELRSVVLPHRAGRAASERLLADCLPTTPEAAQRLGLVDEVGPSDPGEFTEWARRRVTEIAADPPRRPPPVDTGPARGRELDDMWHDIFHDRHGFAQRRRAFLGLA